MEPVIVTNEWKAAFPGAAVGILSMGGVSNPADCLELEGKKKSLENSLRTKFAGRVKADLLNMDTVKVYDSYYRKFKKTYHVQLQLETIIFKGKSIPHVAALVEAMFMAEIENQLLTAGHDLDMLELPVTLDVSKGGERYMLLRGQDEELKTGDMMMFDKKGIISSIIYGPDQRTQITSSTHKVMFVTYAPAGIGEEMILHHLETIQDYVLMISPQAEVIFKKIYTSN
jgi:DNA/RNA-binding domain of Phe-tRNA-synthetase-like protein